MMKLDDYFDSKNDLYNSNIIPKSDYVQSPDKYAENTIASSLEEIISRDLNNSLYNSKNINSKTSPLSSILTQYNIKNDSPYNILNKISNLHNYNNEISKTNIESLISYNKDITNENIIKSDYTIFGDNDLGSIYSDYVQRGYRTVPEEPKPSVARPEVKATPGYKHTELMATLRAQYRGLEFLGSTVLEHASAKQVEILHFSHQTNSGQEQFHVVRKDASASEQELSRQLAQHGLPTPHFFDIGSGFYMGHVGESDARAVARAGSESDVVSVCEDALRELAYFHTIGGQLIADGVMALPVLDHEHNATQRILDPMGICVDSLEAQSFLKAYRSFVAASGNQLLHGDAHGGNYRTKNGSSWIDFETVQKGAAQHDVARFINDVMRQKPDLKGTEFAQAMYAHYLQYQHMLAHESGAPLLFPTPLSTDLANDDVLSVGNSLVVARAVPALAEERTAMAAERANYALGVLRNMQQHAGVGKDRQKAAYHLEQSFIDLMRVAVQPQMQEVGSAYRGKKRLVA